MKTLTRRSLLALGAGVATSGLPLSAATKLPRPAPELSITLNSGEQALLSRLRGKVVMLEVLLTTCPHCQRCAMTMQKVLNDYAAKGVAAMGAAVNDGARNDLLRFTAISGAKFPVGVAARDGATPFILSEKPPVYFPQLVLIDRHGQIRAQFAGTDEFFLNEEANLRKQIDALLNEPASVTSRKAAPKK